MSATADGELVRATVLNLLLNAAQAMSGHGRIDVLVSRRDGSAVIAVRDTGPGIPEAIRDQVCPHTGGTAVTFALPLHPVGQNALPTNGSMRPQ